MAKNIKQEYSSSEDFTNELKKDLLKIDVLIAHYEELPVIIEYKLNDKIPNNHKEGTQLNFYKRTLEKRNEVIKYFLHDMEVKIKEKSNKKSSSLNIPEFFKINHDFPYKDLLVTYKGITDCKIDFEKLDYRLINPLQHKAFIYNFKSDISLGYCKEIDDEIAENIDFHQLIETICKCVKSLPLINERNEIFEELKYLYHEEKWYGFYALALPQIEGIFAEMINIVESKTASGSLRNKVRHLRNILDIDYFFDYYEFFLPEERNIFCHLGKIDNVKIRCSYLLLDLVHILELVEELNSPEIQVNNIIEYGKDYFKDISNYAKFFQLVQKTKDDWTKNKINKFVNETLLKNVDFILFIDKLQVDFEIATKDFENNFAMLSEIYGTKKIQIFTQSNADIFSKKEELNQLFDRFQLFIEDLKLLIEIQIFISKFVSPKYEIDESTKSKIKSFQRDNEQKLKTITKLKKTITFNFYGNFITTKDKWVHNKK